VRQRRAAPQYARLGRRERVTVGVGACRHRGRSAGAFERRRPSVACAPRDAPFPWSGRPSEFAGSPRPHTGLEPTTLTGLSSGVLSDATRRAACSRTVRLGMQRPRVTIAILVACFVVGAGAVLLLTACDDEPAPSALGAVTAPAPPTVPVPTPARPGETTPAQPRKTTPQDPLATPPEQLESPPEELARSYRARAKGDRNRCAHVPGPRQARCGRDRHHRQGRELRDRAQGRLRDGRQAPGLQVRHHRRVGRRRADDRVPRQSQGRRGDARPNLGRPTAR